MKTYKFDTKISERGIIRLPLSPILYNKEVEIIIIPKTANEKTTTHKASDFVNKWAGFLTNSETDNSKLNYLIEKYK